MINSTSSGSTRGGKRLGLRRATKEESSQKLNVGARHLLYYQNFPSQMNEFKPHMSFIHMIHSTSSGSTGGGNRLGLKRWQHKGEGNQKGRRGQALLLKKGLPSLASWKCAGSGDHLLVSSVLGFPRLSYTAHPTHLFTWPFCTTFSVVFRKYYRSIYSPICVL